MRDIFGTINHPPLLDNVIRVLRFSPVDPSWTLLQLPVNLLSPDGLKWDVRPGSISELAGVDEQGNISYWDDPLSPNTPLLTIFDTNGQFVAQIPSQTLISAGTGNLLYQSPTGDIVFLNNDLPTSLAFVDPADFLSTEVTP